MIDWSLVGSIVVALSIFYLGHTLGLFIYSWLTRGGDKADDKDGKLNFQVDIGDDKLFNEGNADFVFYDKDGKLNIQVDTGDPYESGIFSNITYCPYCGRNLKELYGPFVRSVMKENKDGNDH